MRPPAPRNDAGFTVLELLVALAICAVVVAFIPSTLRLGQRVWESDARFRGQEGLAAFRHAIEDRLEQAMPVFVRDPTAGLRIDFEGAPDHLAFVAPSSLGPAGGGVYRFVLSADEGRGLALRQTLYRQASGDKPPLPAMTHVAPAKIRALSLRYFGEAVAGEAASWQAQWPRRDALPDLVEIRFGAGRGEPDQRVVVALRLKPS